MARRISELTAATLPLTGSSTLFPVTIGAQTFKLTLDQIRDYTNSVTIPIAQGGTGATSASGARNNLGVAARGANSDITSLTGLTTALSISQGGTGATTAVDARTNLGLGNISTQNSNGVAITGGNINGTTIGGTNRAAVSATVLNLDTALSIGNGGTGAGTAAGARTNLGLDPTTAQYNASQLRGQAISTATPTTGNILAFRSSQWQPQQARTVVQVVSAVFNTPTVSTSGTYSNLGLSVSITPTNASSQIVVWVNLAGVYKNGSTFLLARLSRTISGNTVNTVFDNGSGYTNSTTENLIGSSCYNFVDNPSSTSTINYAIQIASGTPPAGVTVNTNSSLSSIIAMEIL